MKQLAREIQIPVKYKVMYMFFFFMVILTNLLLIECSNQLVTLALEMDLSSFYRVLIEFLGILGLNIVFTFFDQRWFRTITNKGELSLKKHTLEMYLKNQSYVEEVNPATLCSKINQDVITLSNWLSIGKINMSCQFLFLLIYVGAMMMYDFRIASITILIVLAAFGFAKIISEKQAVYFSKFKEIQEKISLAIHNDFLNQFTIIQLGIGKFVKNKLAKILENRVIRKLSLYTSLDEAMLLFMTEFIPIAVFCSGILLLNHKENGIGVALSLMLIAQKLNEPVIVMAELYSDRKNAEQVYERIKDIYARPADSLERKKIAGKFERLVFDLNGYAYDGNFQNKKSGKVKAEIKKGDMVTIQGASGCGKSTVLKLITRLIDPKNMDGALYYNGISLTEFERDSLYNHILMIEQDPPIIEGSLRENLELGDSFSESEIFEACELAGLSKWIENRGLDEKIKENGGNLSGGEKHRIAIARILLRKPDVLILDEALTGIEEEMRHFIVQNLVQRVREQRTTLITVSHESDFSKIANKTIRMKS